MVISHLLGSTVAVATVDGYQPSVGLRQTVTSRPPAVAITTDFLPDAVRTLDAILPSGALLSPLGTPLFSQWVVAFFSCL
jgi:hypothetical protein